MQNAHGGEPRLSAISKFLPAKQDSMSGGAPGIPGWCMQGTPWTTSPHSSMSDLYARCELGVLIFCSSDRTTPLPEAAHCRRVLLALSTSSPSLRVRGIHISNHPGPGCIVVMVTLSTQHQRRCIGSTGSGHARRLRQMKSRSGSTSWTRSFVGTTPTGLAYGLCGQLSSRLCAALH